MEVTSSKTCASENRKVRKPLMERKRRARMNKSLNDLKQMLIEANNKDIQGKLSKLDKADVLEMTVQHLQKLHKQYISKTAAEQYTVNLSEAHHRENVDPMRERINQSKPKVDSRLTQCNIRTPNGITILPTKLSNGDLIYILPKSLNEKTLPNNIQIIHRPSYTERDPVWRPW